MSNSKITGYKIFGIEANKGRWLFVITGLVIYICLGSVYSYSIFKSPIQDLFGISATESSYPYMFMLMCGAIIAFFGGKLLTKVSPRKVCISGGILVGLGWVLSGLLPRIIPDIWTLVITYSIIGGAGVGLAYGGPIAVTNRWFPDKKGLAVGLTLAGFGGSPFVIANVATPVMESIGPLNTFLVFGFAFFVLIISLSLLLRFPPEDWRPAGQEAGTSGEAPLQPADFNRRQMLGISPFWGLFSVYTIGSLAGLMVIGVSSQVGTEIIRMDAAAAGLFVGVFAVFNGAGRPLFGWLTDRITPRWAAVISLAVMAAASIIMVGAAEGKVALYAVSFCALWLCYGGWLAIAPATTSTFFGTKNYPMNYGVVFLGNGLGAILGSLISGQSRDLFGNYDVAFMITAGLAVIGVVISLIWLKPPLKSAGRLPAGPEPVKLPVMLKNDIYIKEHGAGDPWKTARY